MTMLARRPAATRTFRLDAAQDHTPESLYLRRWLKRQAALHADLLTTVEAANRLAKSGGTPRRPAADSF